MNPVHCVWRLQGDDGGGGDGIPTSSADTSLDVDKYLESLGIQSQSGPSVLTFKLIIKPVD